MTSVAVEEVVLPLDHHSQVLVVQHDGLGGDLLDVGGGQFLNVHQEGSVAIDVDHLLVGASHLGAQGRRVTVTHGTETGAGDELAGELVLVPLTRPHLMLADAGGDDRFTLRETPQFLDDHLGQDELLAVLLERLNMGRIDDLPLGRVAERSLGLPFCHLAVPGGEGLLDALALGDERVHALQGVLEVSMDRQIGALVFVVFGGVDVQVDNGGSLGELAESPRHAVIKADAEGQ